MGEDRHVVVTGAGRGIGEACADAVSDQGARVTCLDLDGESAASTAASIRERGGRATGLACDVRDMAGVRSALESATAHHGPVHAVIANAGGAAGERTPFLEMTEPQWTAMLDRNLRAAFVCGSVFGRHLVEGGGGAIVFMTSVTAEIAQPGLAHYAAAKGGVRQLMRTMALELAPHGVRVNAVAPGVTLTPGNRDGLSQPGVLDRCRRDIPLGRVADPADIAGAAVHLIGDAARYTTGTTLVVDGGMTLP